MAEAAAAPGAKLDVVVVNWNSGPLLRRCLEAIAASPGDAARLNSLVVVDNGSSEGLPDFGDLTRLLPLRILANRENRGFGAACNQGAATGDAPYVLFLNPDVRIRPGAFSESIDFFENGAPQRIGALGIRLIGEDGQAQRCCARFPTPLRILGQAFFLDRLAPWLVAPHFMLEWDHLTTRSVDQVMGAFLMLSRPLFASLGGFDERFFVYYEDVDLCLRIRQGGSLVIHYAEPAAVHEGQGTTRRIKDVRLFYSLRSRMLYAAKHFSRAGLAATLAATLLIEPCARILLSLLRGRFGDARATLTAYRLLLGAMPTLSRRKDG